MAFGKKKNLEAAATSARPAKGGAAGAKKRKPNELLSSVVKESVVSSAVAVMEDNPRFALPNGAYVILGLKTDSIGGLSQKQKNDEAKGSIIELIRSDAIAVAETTEMLQYETLGIIPTEGTLERMGEFQLLTDAPYAWVTFQVDDSEQVTATPIGEATYAQALKVSRGEASIGDFLTDELREWAGIEDGEGAVQGEVDDVDDEQPLSDDEEIDDEETGVEAAPEAEHDDEALEDDEEIDDGADDSAGDDEPLFGADDEVEPLQEEEATPEQEAQYDDEEEPSYEGEDLGQGASYEESYEQEPAPDDAYGQYVQAHADSEFTEEQVRSTLVRRFLNDDIGLEVDLAPFEQTFNTSAPVVSFAYDENATDWLNQQLAAIARQANAELARLHSDNVSELRQLWVRMESRNVEQVVLGVDPDREGSDFYELMRAAEADYADLRAKAEQTAAKQRDEIRKAFEDEVAKVGEQARVEAENRHRLRGKAGLERQLSLVGGEVDRRNEEIFNAAKQTINEMRLRTAHTRAELGQTRILEILMDRHREHVGMEQELMQAWSQQMSEFVDQYRKDDIARSTALQEQLARGNAVADAQAAHERAMAAQRQEHSEAIARLEGELAKLRQEHLVASEQQRADFNASLDLEREHTRIAQEQASVVVAQTKGLREEIAQASADEIAALKAAREAYADELEQSGKLHKRTTTAIVAVGVLATLAALLAGTVLGFSWSNSNFADTISSGASTTQVQTDDGTGGE